MAAKKKQRPAVPYSDGPKERLSGDQRHDEDMRGAGQILDIMKKKPGKKKGK